MRVMITGAAGFAGSHLTDLFVEEGAHDILAIDRVPTPPQNLAQCLDKIRYELVDLDDFALVDAAFDSFRPELIYHLAAQAFVPAYEGAWEKAAIDAMRITLHLFETARRCVPDARFVLISSAEVYGTTFSELDGAADETVPTRPANVYGATKMALELFAGSAHTQNGLDVVVLRPFNHIGPRQSDHFVCSSFAKQVAEIESGAKEPVIRVGNLDAERDFTDVRDMVKAYRIAADRCEPNVPYNICAGDAVSMRAVLDTLVELSGVEVEVVVEPDRRRSADVMKVCGDSGRFRRRTGWSPGYSLRQSLGDTLQFWRAGD